MCCSFLLSPSLSLSLFLFFFKSEQWVLQRLFSAIHLCEDKCFSSSPHWLVQSQMASVRNLHLLMSFLHPYSSPKLKERKIRVFLLLFPLEKESGISPHFFWKQTFRIIKTAFLHFLFPWNLQKVSSIQDALLAHNAIIRFPVSWA